MGYENRCYDSTCGVMPPHYHGDVLFNFEQFGCPARNNGAHAITLYSTPVGWWLWRHKEYRLRCYHCKGTWEVFK